MYRREFSQFGTLAVIVLLPSFIILSVLLLLYGLPTSSLTIILLMLLLIILICLLVFYKLTIIIDSTYLSFKFGIGLIGKRYKLSDIKTCKPVVNNALYGIGIRMIPKGMLYNVSGFKAIELSFHNKSSIVRIGSDQPENIAEVVNRIINVGKTEAIDYKNGRINLSPFWLLAIFIIIIPVGLIISTKKDISVKKNIVDIKIEGLYGLIIPYNSISQLDTVSELPPIAIRTNGYSFGKTCVGNFRLTDKTDVKLFIKKGFPPYMLVKTIDNKVIYINFENAEETKNLYRFMKEKTINPN